MLKEEWRDVVGYEAYFRISNYGNVFSKRTNKILKQRTSASGHKLINFRIGGRKAKPISIRIHRMVAEAFLEPPNEELLMMAERTHYKIVPVNHKDGDKQNNFAENLEWISYSENSQHAYDNNLCNIKTGTDKPNSKITENDVLEIRKRITPNCRTNGYRALAEEFGLSKSTVMDIVKRKTWKHV